MTKSQRMQPVMRIAEMREQTAAKDLANSQRYLQEQQARLAELQQYQAEYTRDFQLQGSSGISVARFQELQRFLASLGQAIEQQQQLIEHAARVCEQKKRIWQQAYGKSKSLDKVVQRYLAQEQYDQGQREQKETDEVAQQSSTRRKLEHDE